MWALAGLGGLMVAVALWQLALRLVPDSRGRSFTSLPDLAHWVLGAAAVISGAVGAAAVAAFFPASPAAVAFAAFAAVTPVLAVLDAVMHRLPFIVSGGLGVVAAVGFSWDTMASGGSERLERAALAALIVGILALAWWWVFEGEAGPGDVALLTVIGGFAGWLSWITVGVALFAGFALATLAVVVTRWGFGKAGAYHPLGSFLLAGWWAAFALAAMN